MRVPELSLTFEQVFLMVWVANLVALAITLGFLLGVCRSRCISEWRQELDSDDDKQAGICPAHRDQQLVVCMLGLCCAGRRGSSCCGCCCGGCGLSAGAFKPAAEMPESRLLLAPGSGDRKWSGGGKAVRPFSGSGGDGTPPGRGEHSSGASRRRQPPIVETSILPRYQFFVWVLAFALAVRVVLLSIDFPSPPGWFRGAVYAGTPKYALLAFVSPLWYALYWIADEVAAHSLLVLPCLPVPSSSAVVRSSIVGTVFAIGGTALTWTAFIAAVVAASSPDPDALAGSLRLQRVMDVVMFSVTGTVYAVAVTGSGLGWTVRSAFSPYFVVSAVWRLAYAAALAANVYGSVIGVAVVSLKTLALPSLFIGALAADTRFWRGSDDDDDDGDDDSEVAVDLDVDASLDALDRPRDGAGRAHAAAGAVGRDSGGGGASGVLALGQPAAAGRRHERRSSDARSQRSASGSISAMSVSAVTMRAASSAERDAMIARVNRAIEAINSRVAVTASDRADLVKLTSMRRALMAAADPGDGTRGRAASVSKAGAARRLTAEEFVHDFGGRGAVGISSASRTVGGAPMSRLHHQPLPARPHSGGGGGYGATAVTLPSAVQGLRWELMENVRVTDLLGSGSFAAVYKCSVQTSVFAIKKFHNVDLASTQQAAVAPNEALQAAFELLVEQDSHAAMADTGRMLALRRMHNILSEVLICARLSASPYIVTCHGAASDWGEVGVLFEYCNKGTLTSAIKEQDMTVARRLRYAVQIAKAIRHVHSTEPATIHGDIKSDNILLKSTGRSSAGVEDSRALLGDFGEAVSTARLLAGDTEAKRQRGTPLWMAPEQLRAGNRVTSSSTATDIYTFGHVLGHLWNLQLPWHKEREEEQRERDGSPSSENIRVQILRFVMRQQRPALLFAENEVGAAFKKVYDACLDPDPKKRPDADSVVHQLIGVQCVLRDALLAAPEVIREQLDWDPWCSADRGNLVDFADDVEVTADEADPMAAFFA
ncbi:hypothetical protein FNF31_04777 [Cafeteria roenbergensis]|uniref:Protein kinase domain-containing protein n=1 Tax=Cafeteria roenbergensis TaxID=33653 RepID=A0A5A8D305_CAFRO|nr:hypothetical protein FNF31_04777 [Cafeteria roenbergensis]